MPDIIHQICNTAILGSRLKVPGYIYNDHIRTRSCKNLVPTDMIINCNIDRNDYQYPLVVSELRHPVSVDHSEWSNLYTIIR